MKLKKSKIEPFWPFEEISIFSHGGHLGYRTALTDTILKGDHPRIIKFLQMAKTALFEARKCPNLNCISIMMSCLTYITGFFMNFELSLVEIGSVVSEEKKFF
jgi:hypothetical protein